MARLLAVPAALAVLILQASSRLLSCSGPHCHGGMEPPAFCPNPLHCRSMSLTRNACLSDCPVPAWTAANRSRLALQHPSHTSTSMLPFSTAPNDPCANPPPNWCAFYADCLEAHARCGPSGYPLGYGLKYCALFSHTKSNMTLAGRAWVARTMLCLQRALVPYSTGVRTASCAEIKEIAFKSHPKCYVESGVCELPPGDWAVVVATVGLHELFGSVGAIEAVVRTGEGCAEFWVWMAERGIVREPKDERMTGWVGRWEDV